MPKSFVLGRNVALLIAAVSLLLIVHEAAAQSTSPSYDLRWGVASSFKNVSYFPVSWSSTWAKMIVGVQAAFYEAMADRTIHPSATVTLGMVLNSTKVEWDVLDPADMEAAGANMGFLMTGFHNYNRTLFYAKARRLPLVNPFTRRIWEVHTDTNIQVRSSVINEMLHILQFSQWSHTRCHKIVALVVPGNGADVDLNMEVSLLLTRMGYAGVDWLAVSAVLLEGSMFLCLWGRRFGHLIHRCSARNCKTI